MVGAIVSLDYKISLHGETFGSDEYKAIVKKVNLRAAKRLLGLCQAQRGIYIKAGQHLASLSYAIPREFTDTLSVLQDKAAYHGFKAIEQTFLTEMGKHPLEVFKSFEEVPIASASLAQVHVAYDSEGRKYAVKVQYPDILDLFRGDISTISFLMKIVAKVFPDFQFEWILPEFDFAMKQELNFVNEAKNSEKTKELFKNYKDDIYIPKVIWSLTSRKILTMEFVEGIKINDVKSMERENLDKKKVAEILLKCFSRQIFEYGWVHSDPHPGNIFVRKNKKNQPQIILLDHGLYRELPEEIRINYCKLWQSIIYRKEKDIEYYSKQLGAGRFYKLFILILTFRTVSNKNVGLSQKISNEEIKEIRNQFSGFTSTVKAINEMLEGISRDLLFVLRTKNILNSIIRILDPDLNRFKIMARISMDGLEEGTPGPIKSFYMDRKFEISIIYHIIRVAFEFAMYQIRCYLGLQTPIDPLLAKKMIDDKETTIDDKEIPINI